MRRIAIGLAVLILVAGAYLLYCLATLPFNGGLAVTPAPGARSFVADDGTILAVRGTFKGEKLRYDQIPPDLVRALIASEDRRFFEHPGIDLHGTLRALWRDLTLGEAREGGSTITQQLARMLYLTPERTLRRKVQEAMLALWLERHQSKQEILTRYLDTAYFGDGVYGIDAAAKRYFGKPAQSLTLSESAMLIGLLRAPTSLDPRRSLDAARERAGAVLDAMVKSGALSREGADAARRRPAMVQAAPRAPIDTGFFVDAANLEATRLLGTPAVDLTLATTLDPEIQALAESIVERYLAGEGKARNVGQAALVAMARDGAVLAMIGGRDYSESQFNRVIQAERQPGSLFKLFVYLAALDRGMTPDAIALDRPVAIGNWKPDNFEGRFLGRVSLRQAFAQSLNSVAAQLGQDVGTSSIIATAKALGIKSKLADVPSLALGSAEVNLMEMVQAYATVAFGGTLVEPYAVREIRRGERLLFHRGAPASAPVIDEQRRAAMLDLLAAVVREGTGKAADIPGEVGGKTGTTQESRDAWFIGFTPQIIVGVWVGNDDHSPMKSVTGGDMPARIWRDFVSAIPPERLRSLASAEGEPATPASVIAGAQPAQGAGAPALLGIPDIIDTATLAIDGHRVQLLGVEGLTGAAARDFARYIHARTVACQPSPTKPQYYRCTVDGHDLSAAVLYNGGGRASADATPDLESAESAARTTRTGIWATR